MESLKEFLDYYYGDCQSEDHKREIVNFIETHYNKIKQIMEENWMETEIKAIRKDDDIYICRSDLILMLAKTQNIYIAAENHEASKAINEILIEVAKYPNRG